MKRILIYTNHFYPENFKVNDIAFYLAENKENEVTVVTCIPNYPNRSKFKAYGFFDKRVETIKNVKVIRLPLIYRGAGTPLRMILNYLSFSIATILHGIYLGFTKPMDCIFVHHTSPIFIAIPAIIIKKIQKCKVILWNLDLWPESVQAASPINNKFILRLLNRLVKNIYNHIDKMLIGSKGFKGPVMEKGIDPSKIDYLPNWAEEIFTTSLATQPETDLPKGFVVMYGGNVGEAQDFEQIIEAAKLTKEHNSDIKWVIVGDGRKKDWIEQAVQKNDLEETVFLLGRQPLESMPGFFAASDLLLVSLKSHPIFDITVPAKLQAYMASSKPIVGMINGEGNRIIKEAMCGLSCSSGNGTQLARNVIEMYGKTEAERIQMGKNGQVFYDKFFDKKKNLNLLSKWIDEVVHQSNEIPT